MALLEEGAPVAVLWGDEWYGGTVGRSVPAGRRIHFDDGKVKSSITINHEDEIEAIVMTLDDAQALAGAISRGNAIEAAGGGLLDAQVRQYKAAAELIARRDAEV